MADAKTVSPLLDDFSLGSPFSSHNGIICCPAIHAVTKEKFILKQVSVPESQTQVNAMLLTGACADQTAAQSYYEDVTHGLEEEIRLLERLAQTRGFAPFYSHQSTPKANGEVGMDLWVLSPYRTTLSAYARRNAMTHLNAVNLGIDLCAALTLSRKAGYLYQNLKPDNIFVTSQRQFQLGDFGFLPLEDLPYATFPAKYRGPFAAPELFDDFGEMNATIDLYALGMVLYLVYNGGQGPFAESQEGAEARRLKGEALPPPAYADYEMAAIILKAAAFRPEDRWQSPEAMGQALVSYMQRNPVNDSVIAAPIVTAPTLDAEAAALDARAEAAQPEPEPEPSVEAPGSEPEPQPAPSPVPEPQPEPMEPADAPPSPEVQEAPEAPVQEEPPVQEEAPDETLPQEKDQDPEAEVEVTDPELAEILSRAQVLLDSSAGEAPASTPAVPAQPEQTPAPTEQVSPPQEAPEAPAEQTQEAGEPAPRRSVKGLIIFLSVLLVLAALAVGAYYYYIRYYCVPIQQLEVVNGTLDSFQIRLATDADPSLLHLTCQDTYGNTYEAPLSDGTATFTGLSPNTQYTVTFSGYSGSGYTVSAVNDYGKQFTDPNHTGTLQLPAGGYTFYVRQDNRMASGKITVSGAMTVRASLPTGDWFEENSLQISSGYDAEFDANCYKYTLQNHTATVQVPDSFTGRLYPYFKLSTSGTGAKVKAVYTDVSGAAREKDIPAESNATSIDNALSRGAAGNTVILRASKAGSDNYTQSVDLTLQLDRMPTLGSLRVTNAADTAQGGRDGELFWY